MSQEAVCIKCGAPSSFCCQRCLESYCSSECQILDWKMHKNTCYQMPQLMAIKKGSRQRQNDYHYSNGPRQNDYHHQNVSQMRRPHQNNNNSINKDVRQQTSERDSLNVSNGITRIYGDNHFSLKVRAAEKNDAWKSPQIPPLATFFNAIVQFIEELDNCILWVTEAKYAKCLGNMLTDINRNVSSEHVCNADDIYVGAVVAAPLQNVFYRAEVRSVQSEKMLALVRLIDYGNELLLPYAKLHPSTNIPIMTNMPAYAFRVKVSHEFGPVELESIINIRISASAADAAGQYFKVEVKPKTVPLHISVDVLSKSPKLSVARLFPGTKNALLCLHNDENSDMNSYLNTEHGIKFDYDTVPAEGTFVAARVDKMWHRGCLLGHWEQNYLVYLIDEGCVGMCQQIKKIPDTFVLQPMRILLITSAEKIDCAKFSALRQELSLKLLPDKLPSDSEQPKYLACALYAGDVKLFDVMASNFTGFLEELSGVNYWAASIPDGSSVFITDIITHIEFFISLARTKKYPAIFASLADKCMPYLSTDAISIGEIVLVKDNEVYFRGEIISTSDGDFFDVKNIDTGTCYKLPRRLFCKANRLIRTIPSFLRKVKLIKVEDIKYEISDNKALAALEDHLREGTNFNVVLIANKLDSVDLLYGPDGNCSLAKKLMPLVFEERPANDTAEKTPLPPSPPDTSIIGVAPVNLSTLKISSVAAALLAPPQPSPMLLPTETETISSRVAATKATPQLPALPSQVNATIEPHNISQVLNIPSLKDEHITGIASAKFYTLNDLEVIPITLGDNIKIFVLFAISITDGFITASDYTNKTISMEMNKHFAKVSKYCKCSHLTKGFKPRIDELCLAIFPEDGEWYRAVCISEPIDNGNSFMVLFVDFGNESRVKSECILPMTKDLMFPANANMCYIENLPKGLTKETCNKFVEAVDKNPVIMCKVAPYKKERNVFTVTIKNIDALLK